MRDRVAAIGASTGTLHPQDLPSSNPVTCGLKLPASAHVHFGFGNAWLMALINGVEINAFTIALVPLLTPSLKPRVSEVHPVAVKASNMSGRISIKTTFFRIFAFPFLKSDFFKTLHSPRALTSDAEVYRNDRLGFII
jgi:hypothetical protein